MGFFNSNNTATQTNTLTPELPEYIAPHVNQILDTVGGVQQPDGTMEGGLIYEPEEAYGGDRIAGFSQDEIDSHEMIRQGIGGYEPYMDTADTQAGVGLEALNPEMLASLRGGVDNATGVWDDPNNFFTDATGVYNPNAVAGLQGTIDDGSSYSLGQEYFNPYQQNVIDVAMSNMADQQNQDWNKIGAAASAGGAFGGGRHGIVEAETIKNFGEARTETMTDLLNKGYTQAQAQQELHRQRQLQGAKLTGTNMLNEANVNLGAGTGTTADNAAMSDSLLRGAGMKTDIQSAGADAAYRGSALTADLANMRQSMGLTDATALDAVGATERSLEQDQLDVNYNDYLDARDRPFELTSFYSDIINGVPSSQQQILSSSETSTEGNSLADLLGTVGTIAGIGEDMDWWG